MEYKKKMDAMIATSRIARSIRKRIQELKTPEIVKELEELGLNRFGLITELRERLFRWEVRKEEPWRICSKGEVKIYAECAGIAKVRGDDRRKILELVEKIIPPSGELHGYTTLIDHHIDVQRAQPVRRTPRRMSPKILEFAQEKVKKIHKKGIIEQSTSE